MSSKNNPNIFFAIGLMSGTSLDGLDIAYTEFTLTNKKWNFELLKSKTISYPYKLKNKLKQATYLSGLELTLLNKDLGDFFANETLKFIATEKITQLNVIGSHGHTVFHQPNKKYTLQIGDAMLINLKTKTTVVSDFRSQDIALGGQGAPLVPIGDKLLFPEYDYRLNLGGFANISFEEPDSGKTKAFDICAVNTILNFFANKLDKEYDNKGLIAKTGNTISPLLNDLNNIEFYKQQHPKSLSTEWNSEIIHPILKEYSDEKIEDLMNTYTKHIAQQIGKTLLGKNKNVLISGGGTFNEFLISEIRNNTTTTINIEDENITNFKEAIIFSFLAILKITNKVNCLSSVTGAVIDHSSGVIHNSFPNSNLLTN
jgi:anhydro-N-acetylmuramic acid kinase